MAFGVMQTARTVFDTVTGYNRGRMTEEKYLQRIVFLESIAGVPGMVAGMVRHLHSLRSLRRDHGWIHTLLEEAENERTHLLWAMGEYEAGRLTRWAILGAQGVAVNLFFLSYLLAPRACHRFVGYLEEEAVKTYTGAIEALDKGLLPKWSAAKASPLARKYWHLPEDATFRDVLCAIRADEVVHRQVNHVFADIPQSAPNPFKD